MTSGQRQEELLKALLSHEVLRLRGFNFSMCNIGGVVVDRRGHVRGLWREESDRLAWTPASHNGSTHSVEDVAAAVRFTLVVLSVT